MKVEVQGYQVLEKKSKKLGGLEEFICLKNGLINKSKSFCLSQQQKSKQLLNSTKNLSSQEHK